MRGEVIDLASATLRLLKIDVSNRCESVGIAISNLLKEVSISSEKKMKFKKECRMMIVKILTKVKERSPLKYSVVRNASSLSPVNMVRKKEECILKFDALLMLYTKRKN